jgi:hypothetical protein
MKDHIPTLAALAALAMLLATVALLVLKGQKPGEMAMLGLGTAIGTIVSGFSPSFSRAPSQVSNSPGAHVNDSIPNQPAREGQKA